MIGGPNSQRLIVASAATLNTKGTAGDILQLLHQSKVTRDVRFQANEVRSVTRERANLSDTKKQKNSPLVLYFIQSVESWMPTSTMKSSGGWSIVWIMLQRSKKRK